MLGNQDCLGLNQAAGALHQRSRREEVEEVAEEEEEEAQPTVATTATSRQRKSSWAGKDLSPPPPWSAFCLRERGIQNKGADGKGKKKKVRKGGR